MDQERLLSGYVLRVSIRRGRWSLVLLNVETGEVNQFSSFEDLKQHLETFSHSLANDLQGPAELQ